MLDNKTIIFICGAAIALAIAAFGFGLGKFVKSKFAKVNAA
jgi:Flp pilus assembly pilin Flp